MLILPNLEPPLQGNLSGRGWVRETVRETGYVRLD